MHSDNSLLEFSMDERLVWSTWFWNQRLVSTLKNRKAQFALNYQITDIIKEVETMSKMHVRSESNGSKNIGSNLQWVNVSISDEDIQAIERWLDDEPNLLLEFVRLALDGYAVSVKPSPDGKGFMATLTHPPQGAGVSGVGLSAFSDDPHNAIGCLLYKFIVKCERSLVPPSSTGERKFR